MEMVERKGKGHPDVLCDKAAEELSIALSRHYLQRYGRVLHHNVDKCVLVGGQSTVTFGGGEVLEPIYLLLVGRAVGSISNGGGPDDVVPVGKFAVRHTKQWLSDTLRHIELPGDFIIDYKIRAGSTDLVGNFDEAASIPRANDTSFAVAYAPMTETERIVLESEQLLNSTALKARAPQVGEDIKIMAVRQNGQIQVTVAAALISTLTESVDHYLDTKRRIGEAVAELATQITDKQVRVQVNTADMPERGAEGCYLAVTGTSAEHGDDGQVGRGNRANGLIAPFRPMTLEAAAGKNPISHVGKTYNVAAQRIVDRLVEEDLGIGQAYCYLLSQIGRPITEPHAVGLEICTSRDLAEVKPSAVQIVEEVLADMPNVWHGFLKRAYPLY
jgi:S-adenosylmethionine synthetase